MAEIPEHLQRRAEEARARAAAKKAAVASGATAEPASDATPAPPGSEPVETTTGSPGKVSSDLLARSAAAKAARAAKSGGSPVAPTSGAAVGVAERPAPVTPAVTTPAGAAPVAVGHQRLLTVVKAGSIQDPKATPTDKVTTWPHLLLVEFVAALACTAVLTVMSIFVNAPLLELANYNQTPNPSKAPWYFLGLQELLTMFHPMVAGVTIPGMGLFILILAPYVDKNPSNRPENRKLAISLFALFMMFWAVLVIIGSFFRGPGFNFILPWQAGVYFEL